MGVADPKRRRVKCRRKAEHDPVPGSPELASGTAARVPLTWRGGPVPSGPAEWRKRMEEQSPQQRSRQGCAFRACKARPRRKAARHAPSSPGAEKKLGVGAADVERSQPSASANKPPRSSGQGFLSFSDRR